MDNLHNRVLVKMGKGFWFFFAALSLCCFSFELMLGQPPLSSDNQARTVKAGDHKAEASKTDLRKVGSPADSGKNEAVGKSTPKFPQQTLTGAFQTADFGEVKPQVPAPSGMPVPGAEAVDMQEIEDRLLEEQIAESLRRPAYLAGTYFEPSGPNDPEDFEETKEEIEESEGVEAFKDNALADAEIEEEPQDDTEAQVLKTEGSLSGSDKSTEGVLFTESGFPIGGFINNFDEIDDKKLKAQIEESVKNPAYLQTLPAEHGSEATEDQD
jgi:hypothetical protein